MEYFNLFAFQVYPYIAFAVFLIGSWARYDRAMYTWRTGSSQLLSDSGMRLGSNCFHVGILLVLSGHVVGLLTPHAIYSIFITAPQKQLMAMAFGGLFGLVCLLGIGILVWRRFTNPRISATGTTGDKVILVLLLLQLLLGLGTIPFSAQHMDGVEMMALAQWAQHIATFRWGAAEFVLEAGWIYKAHILLGLSLFLVAPFTRLVHVWSIPVSYLWRPYQVVRRRQKGLNYN